jgi:AI-2 transport system permease protein
MSRIWRSRELLVFLLLIVLLLVVGLINPNFWKTRSLMHILNSSLILILVSIGEMFVILTRGIDVSVGAILGLSAVILGVALNAGVALPLAVLLALIVSVLAGMVNAVGVTFLRVPPIIMTLGTLGVYRGLMLIITGGSWIETIPTNIKFFANWHVFGVRFFIWVTLIIVIITAWALRRFKKARYFYAVGDNEEGARLMDIPVRKTLFAAYTLAGLFAGIAAIIFVAQIGFVPMQAGNGQELRAIAADVLGGVNLAGGVGTPLSALVGAIFLTAVDSALVFLKVPGYWNNAVGGAILLAAVYLDYRVRRAVAAQQRQARAAVRKENNHLPPPTPSEEQA